MWDFLYAVVSLRDQTNPEGMSYYRHRCKPVIKCADV